MNAINELYFEWLLGKVCDKKTKSHYSKLLQYLHSRSFVYTIPLDGNRESDGINLRYHFGWDNDIPQVEIADAIDRSECSVFEMMVALSIRMEAILYDFEEDRTSIWFWDMVKSLRLHVMDNKHFDPEKVETALYKFMDRDYDHYTGRGGLFTLANPDHEDLCGIEIWDLAMWKVNEEAEYI